MTTLAEDALTRTALPQLARKEMVHYARHPLFLLSLVLLSLSTVDPPDAGSATPGTSTIQFAIAPAALLGVFGMIIMGRLTRASDRAAEAAGTVPTSQATRTLALASAVVVPLAVALLYYAYLVWGFHHWPPAADGIPVTEVGNGWVYAVLFTQGVIPAVGGPILGLVLARWLPQRGAVPVAAVVLVFAVMLMQGVFEPLRAIRLVMPWTHFAGQMGAEGDAGSYVVMTGSPYWWGAYLVLLCAGGLVVALLRDDQRSRKRLVRLLTVIAVLAAACCFLAITQGVRSTITYHGASGLG